MKNVPDHHLGPVIISAIVVIGFVLMTLGICLHHVPESTTVTTLMTLYGGKFSTTIDYWMGNSSLATRLGLNLQQQQQQQPSAPTTTTTPPQV